MLKTKNVCLPVTKISGFCGHQANSLITDEFAEIWRKGKSPVSVRDDKKLIMSKSSNFQVSFQ